MRFFKSFLALVLVLIFVPSTIFAADSIILPQAEDPGVMYYPGTGVQVKVGDVLVTNGTSSGGLTGHAGIVTSNYTVATIDGYGGNPYEQNFYSWHNKWSSNGNWTKVVRYKDSSVATKAGTWAYDYVHQHSDATYSLSLLYSLSDLSHVYCSKIPWLAYYSYGVSMGYSGWEKAIYTPYMWIDGSPDSAHGALGFWFTQIATVKQ